MLAKRQLCKSTGNVSLMRGYTLLQRTAKRHHTARQLFCEYCTYIHRPCELNNPLFAPSRFLRARKFDPKATQQFIDAEKWRKTNNVDELYRTFDVEEFEQAKKYYPTFTGRRDKVRLV